MKIIRAAATTLCTLGFALAIQAALAPYGHAAKLYKWVDDHGEVHYGDRVPPQDAGKQRQELNDGGVTVKTVPRAKTPQEIAHEKAMAKQRAARRRAARKQAAHDRMLLDTFSSVDDIKRARAGKIEAIDAIIRVTQGRIKSLRAQLEDSTHAAANRQRAGKPVSKALQQRIDTLRTQINKNQAYIDRKRREQDQIRRQYAADMARFRQLQAGEAGDTDTAQP